MKAFVLQSTITSNEIDLVQEDFKRRFKNEKNPVFCLVGEVSDPKEKYLYGN